MAAATQERQSRENPSTYYTPGSSPGEEGRDIAWLEAGEVNHRAGAIPGRPGRAAYRLSHRQQRPRGQNAAVGEAARLPRVKGTWHDVFLALLGLRGLFPMGLGPVRALQALDSVTLPGMVSDGFSWPLPAGRDVPDSCGDSHPEGEVRG